jgi:AmmeMemoRadiSam system protein B/AmmeMemoRadiSam system protein A
VRETSALTFDFCVLTFDFCVLTFFSAHPPHKGDAMKNSRTKLLILFALGALILVIPHEVGCAAEQKIRPAGVAGGFYPSDPKELTQMIDTLLAQVTVPPVQGPLVALICPHAGYQFTGPVAASCFAQLKGRKYTRVVIIAPSHYVNFPFSSIYDGDAYATPLGNVPVDKDFRARLAKLNSSIKISDRGHVKEAENAEHSLEVQLPWLQRTLGDFKLVPIIMGDQNYNIERALGRALAKALLEETPEARAQTLILVSSDLSHYHPYDYAVNVDHQTLHAIEDWDYLSLSRNFAMWERGVATWEACGGGPIVSGMIAAEGLGATHAKILKYLNSGDTTGDKTRVVGYGAVVITRASPADAKKSAEFSLTGRERDALMKIARTSVETAVRDRKMYLVGSTGFPRLEEARGAFVTLKEHGELRGCIGYITPMKSLAETVRDVAAYAALEDNRFTPVTATELPLLEYEISVMSPLRRVLDIKEIKVGKHGLIMKQGETEGILLPQVPVEEHWDRDTFIQETCLKAGLPRQAWKDDDTDIFMFTALVFGEHSAPDATFPDRPNAPGQPQPPLPGVNSPKP